MEAHNIRVGASAGKDGRSNSKARDANTGLRAALKQNELLVHLVRSSRAAWALAVQTVRQCGWIMTRRIAIRRYLAENRVRKLQIGAGPTSLKGWLNTDFRPRARGSVFLDASKRFPFPDSTFDYILAEHVVQEFPYDVTRRMLGECARVLRPGGKLRLSTPDLERMCGLYLAADERAKRYVSWHVENHAKWAPLQAPGFVVNNLFSELRFLFDRSMIEHALRSEGFEAVAFFEPGESDDRELRGVESHGRVLQDEEINRFESFVLEASKGRLYLACWAILVAA
jgi:SAM-dependent methyltransferase